MLLTGCTAIITGAASGIGRECAALFLSNGATVAGVDIRTDGMSALEALAREHNGRFAAFECDVRNAEAVERVVNETVARFGNVDIVLNVAGITTDVPVTRMSEDVYRRIMDVNTLGVFNFCKYAAAHMKRQRRGVIINTSSVTAQYGTQLGCAYAASKAAILGLTRSLALELAPWGIRVNAVAPGVVNTEMVAALSEAERATCARSIPLGRLGESEDIAEAMLFLASDKAKYITGTTLNVDGGYRPVFTPVPVDK